MIQVQQLHNFLRNVSMLFIAVVNLLDVVVVPKKVCKRILQYWQELHVGGSKINQ